MVLSQVTGNRSFGLFSPNRLNPDSLYSPGTTAPEAEARKIGKCRELLDNVSRVSVKCCVVRTTIIELAAFWSIEFQSFHNSFHKSFQNSFILNVWLLFHALLGWTQSPL